MTALWIILGILGFFVILFSIPFHVVVEADSDVRVKVRVLFFKYSLFPMQKRKKKPKSKGKAKKKSSGTSLKKAKPASQKPKPKRDIIGLIKLVLKLVTAVLRKFPKHFRVTVLRYEIFIATGDAAKTALLYGTATGLSANLFELLRRATRFRIKRKAPVNVYADFVGEKSRADVAIDFALTLWGVLQMLLAAGLAFVKTRAQNKQKQEEKQAGEKTSAEQTPTQNKT